MLETEEKKEFNFDSAENYLLVAQDFPEVQSLGETKGNNITINGVINNETGSRSTIDLNHLKGFDIDHDVTFNVENITFKDAHDRALEVKSSNSEINLVNTSFIGNIALNDGGAIYSKSNVNMTSKGEGVITELTGNTINGTDSGIPIGGSVYIADKSKTLTINAVENGTFRLNDAINGENGYKVNITGDGTGTFDLFGDINNNANVNIENVTVNLADGINRSYEFETLDSDASAKYLIGVDLKEKTSDKFTTLKESTGTITIAGLNIANEEFAEFDKDYIIQILDNKAKTSDLKLALSDELKEQLDGKEYQIGKSYRDVLEDINPTTKWDDKYKIYEQEMNVYGKLGLKDSKDEEGTAYDSIGINITGTEDVGDLRDKDFQDTAIIPWTALETTERKVFYFDRADNVITLQKTGLGEVKGNEFYINGVINNETGSRSTIDLNGFKGFEVNRDAELTNDTELKLNIANVSLKNANERALEINDSNAVINLTNINLINNKSSEKGGAVYSNSNITITADNAKSQITGNTTNGASEAIYIANPDKTLTLNVVKNGELAMNDAINGENGYNVDITGDGTGTYGMYNDIYNANVTIGNTNISTVNKSINTYKFNSFTVTGDINMSVDVDLKNARMDRISASNYGEHSGNINITGIKLLSNTPKPITRILFADNGLKDNIINNVNEVAYSPVYKYDVAYENLDNAGYFVFKRGSGENYKDLNPSVLASSIAAQLGGYLTQLNSYDEAFRNMDMYMLMTKKQRQAMKLRNKYAAADGMMTFDPNQTPYSNTAGWFRPYATFENVNLKNGPSVSNVAYGSFFGAESEMYDLGHGWDGIWGVYVGYNGSHQTYDGVGITQNGGTLGAVGMAYKGNFYTGLTVNVGANAGDASTMYGDDNFSMLMTGVASKTGYNCELADGKFIIQPNFLMSYSFVNTFDYTNAAGVNINSNPLNAIQIEPGVKFIGNLKNGWQPYAGVSMVWNIMDKTEFKANDISLPELSVKPFVKYGVGVRKTWGERLVGYIQCYLTNGGRNGVGLQTGFRWTIGKSSDNVAKTNSITQPKKRIK